MHVPYNNYILFYMKSNKYICILLIIGNWDYITEPSIYIYLYCSLLYY